MLDQRGNMTGKKAIKETSRQWLAATSLHGYSYVQESQIFFCERILWFLITIGFTSMGLWLVMLSFGDWHENPVATTIQTVSMELAQKENFPTVVICPKQSRTYIDEWGAVKAALSLIDHICISTAQVPENCTKYLGLVEQLKAKSLEKLSQDANYDQLQVIHMIMMAFKLSEDDEDFQRALIMLIAKMFGQEKLTPMGLIRILVKNKGTKMLKESFVKVLLDDKCNEDEVKKYTKSFGLNESPCMTLNGSKSPCCDFFGAMGSQSPQLIELAFLSFHYGVPLYIHNHKPLAKYLGKISGIEMQALRLIKFF